MVGHLLGHFELAAVSQVFRNSSGAEAMAAAFCANAGILGAADVGGLCLIQSGRAGARMG